MSITLYKSTLVSHNVVLSHGRTSMRLEPIYWDTLESIAERDKCSISDVVVRALGDKVGVCMTSAIRVYLTEYWMDHAIACEAAIESHARRLSKRLLSWHNDLL